MNRENPECCILTKNHPLVMRFGRQLLPAQHGARFLVAKIGSKEHLSDQQQGKRGPARLSCRSAETITMKKSIAALFALSALSTAAFAANVEIYGQVDTFVAINDNDGDVSTRIGSGAASASHFGLKGTEVINDQMQVMFNLDSAILVDTGSFATGSSGLFDRESWVGVHHNKYGMLSFGRQYTPHFLTFAMSDPTDLSLGSSHSPFFFPSPTGVNGDAADSLVRHSNSLFYASPEIGGATIFAYAALGEEADDKTSSDGNVYNLAANWKSGPLFVMGSVLYQDISGSNPANGGFQLDGTGDPAVRMQAKGHAMYYNFAASYDFGVTKPAIVFMKKTTSTTASEGSRNMEEPEFWVLQIGTSTPMFGGRWSVSAATLHNEDQDDADAWSFGTRYDYPLSKRTKVYVGFEAVMNEDNAKYSVEAGPDSSLHFANEAGVDQRQFFFGINHKF